MTKEMFLAITPQDWRNKLFTNNTSGKIQIFWAWQLQIGPGTSEFHLRCPKQGGPRRMDLVYLGLVKAGLDQVVLVKEAACKGFDMMEVCLNKPMIFPLIET
jgi:hypothetical protein